MERKASAIIFLFVFFFSACQKRPKDQSDNLFHSVSCFLGDNTVSALVEIPMGTSEKWEYNKEKGAMDIEIINGSNRRVNYLPYPINYGMIPQTYLPKELGGDGDPLDILVIGDAVPQGQIVPARVLGVLKFKDRGEQDDKILSLSTTFDGLEAQSLSSMKSSYESILNILTTWFSNYKGEGKMKFEGIEDEQSAMQLITKAHRAYNDEFKND